MTTQPRRLRIAAAALLTTLALTSCTAGPAQHMTSPDLSPVTATVEAAQATGQAAVEAIEAEQHRQAELQRIAEERAAAEKAERQRIAAEKAERERQQRIAAERAAAEQAAKEQAEREQPQKAAAERAQRAPAKKTEPASQKAPAPQEGRTSEPAPKKAGPKAGPMSVEQKKALFRQEMNRWGGAGVSLVVDPSMTSKANGAYSIGHRKISMNPRIPVERIPWIAAHEMAHFHQDRLGGFSLEAFNAQASKANRIYGGSGYSGMDQQADCAAAQMLGGFPVRPSYTSNCTGQRGEAARMLLRGEPIR